MTHDSTHTDRSYRRGAIMGLTIAEAFILIAFALLLLFAFWQWEVQKENTPEVQAFKALPLEQREIVLSSVNDGSMQAFVTLKEQGVDFATPASVESPQEKWRFIDKDDQLRLLDAMAALPEDAQRDLADMVEADQATAALEQFAALQELVKAGQSIETLKRTIAALESQSANQTLQGIAGKIRAAGEQEAALVGAIKSELGELVASVGGKIDGDGAIILPGAALFEQGKANITPQLGRFLAQACGPWLTVLKNSGVAISEVKIEGHASSEWGNSQSLSVIYLENLNLSQLRSQAVLRTCLALIPDPDVLEWARDHLIAVGYSSVRPVMNNGQEDRVASRRVVLSAIPDRNALIDEIGSEAESHREAVRARYDRSLFGGWADQDDDCQNTRQELLQELSTAPVRLASNNCTVVRGKWLDPYTGNTFTNARDIEIDHLVPLKWAWDHGADQWSASKRVEFANDSANLFAVYGPENQDKGAKGPLEWLPTEQQFHCQYVTRFTRVVKTYDLTLTDEKFTRFERLREEKC
jgi:outer membrane protein OmpA-like peptidoglycan-associated protein